MLDNCEHVVEAAAVVADRLLRDAPAVTVVATSREPLGVAGEVVRTVTPLAVPHRGISVMPTSWRSSTP